MLLELKEYTYILLKVFSSNVQSVFPFDISYTYFPLNENYPLITFNFLQCTLDLLYTFAALQIFMLPKVQVLCSM